jgi:hypothetical protein
MLTAWCIKSSVLISMSAIPAIAQVPASKPNTAAGGLRFVQDVLTRGTVEAKPWPDFLRTPKVTKVVVKGNCQMIPSLGS